MPAEPINRQDVFSLLVIADYDLLSTVFDWIAHYSRRSHIPIVLESISEELTEPYRIIAVAGKPISGQEMRSSRYTRELALSRQKRQRDENIIRLQRI